MKIKKILNNNVAISTNDKGEEIIVVGCGIAFKKKVGDLISSEFVEKIFISKDKETKIRLKALLDEIPIEYIRITDKIIKRANQVFEKEINDIIYIAIADHIHRSVERFLNSGELINGLLWDIKRLYKEEFQIGLFALDVIKGEIKVNMPEDEAAFIATHTINAKLKESIPNVIDITKLINEILNIVKYNLLLDLDEDSLSYYTFINNLKFLGQKVVNQKAEKEGNKNDDIYILVSKKYPREHYCMEKVTEFIERKYKYSISIDERLMLILQIVKLKNENN